MTLCIWGKALPRLPTFHGQPRTTTPNYCGLVNTFRVPCSGARDGHRFRGSSLIGYGYWQLIADDSPRKTRSAIPHRKSFPAIAGEIISRVLIRKVQIPQ